MRPIFVARGPSFRVNHTLNSTVNLVDIYPLMCHLLDLKPAANNGSFDRVQDMLLREDDKTTSQPKQKKELSSTHENSTIIELSPILVIERQLLHVNNNCSTNCTSNTTSNVSSLSDQTNRPVIKLVLNITQTREDKRMRDLLAIFGIYPDHFKFINILPLIILIMIIVTFICLCKMEMSKERENVGFSYTPLDNNYIYTRNILTK